MERPNVARAVTWEAVENHLSPSVTRSREDAMQQPTLSCSLATRADAQQWFLYTSEVSCLHRNNVFKTTMLDSKSVPQQSESGGVSLLRCCIHSGCNLMYHNKLHLNKKKLKRATMQARRSICIYFTGSFCQALWSGWQLALRKVINSALNCGTIFHHGISALWPRSGYP